MAERRIENAIIESVFLGTKDCPCLTAYLHLSYDAGGQGFGGYSFDGRGDVGDRRRRGSAFGIDFIAEVLRVTGKEAWEDLPGTPVRADHDHGKVYRIGHYLKDEWFDPSELAAEHRASAEQGARDV